MNDLALMLQGYLETALWSSTDDDGELLAEPRGVEDISGEALREAANDCSRFLDKCDAAGIDWWLDTPPCREHTIAEVLGHDFWLTRNRHGAGFWDGDWPLHGDALDEIAKAFGETDLYVGDDGLLYFMER